MSTFDGNNFYYSGQGVVLIGERDALGKPKNLLPVGNVSALSIAIDTAVLEHKESQTGSRGIDLRLTTETNANLTLTMENFISENLKIALRGDITVEAAGSVTTEVVSAGPGAIAPLDHIKVSAVVVNDATDTTPLLLYVDDSTVYDYKVNLEAGSIEINDGSIVATSALMTTGTETITGLTAANPCVLTVSASVAEVGDRVHINAIVGSIEMNDQTFVVSAVSATEVTLDFDSTDVTAYTSDGAMYVGSVGISVDYDYAAQNLVNALTQGSSDRYLRFEGLNTADSLEPVVVEVFKFSTDPLQQLALIGDDVQQFELQGNVLADPLQTTGSKFFKQRMIR
jgi:hypothetical protein